MSYQLLGESTYNTIMSYQLLGSVYSSEMKLVLVGQERVGKSSSGNTILGKCEFDCRFTSRPLTLTSEKKENAVLGRRVIVVDTPGLFSTQLSKEEVKTQLEEALKLTSPGPNAFLLCIQLGRFTEQEQEGLHTLQKMLGPDVSKHTMVLFTYGDRLDDMDIDQFITGDENVKELLKRCSGRYHVFNNTDMENRDQVEKLLKKVEDLSEAGRLFYNKTPKSVFFRWYKIICYIWQLMEMYFE